MNSILLKLTKRHIQGANGKYVRTQTVKLPSGKNQEIIIFSNDKPLYLGQSTFFGTIIIHESLLNDERLLNYVLLHEMAHKKQWWSYFIIPLLLLVLASFFSVIFALFTLIDSIINRNPGQLLTFLIELLVAGVLLFVPCAFSWVMELDAEFQAIKVIGLVAFTDIRKNLNKFPKPSKTFMVIARMTHPPTSVTIRCWKWLHKNQG
jgi:Zn-dependent protease with chaperone function